MPSRALVVDASLVLKWLLPEKDDDKALRIRSLYQAGRLRLIAPQLLLSEAGNVLCTHVRRGNLTPAQAERAFERMQADAPILLDSPFGNALALGLALRYQRPFYDCLYLALALDNQCDLVTADEKFFNAMHASFPCISLLREVNL